MKYVVLVATLITLFSCNDDRALILDNNILSEYLELNHFRELSGLIACAGGKEGGLFNVQSETSSIFFYPIEGAADFRYFETDSLSDPSDFSQYRAKLIGSEPIFNGYLWKYNNPEFSGERYGVVTYKTEGRIHTCNPIRIKTNVKPTEQNPALMQIDEDGINPKFEWQDGVIDENAIYFQVISDVDNNFVSGTYTFDQNFTFYNLDNVVLNISDTLSTPQLEPDKRYTMTMMAVSEDNWVNLLIEKEFRTR